MSSLVRPRLNDHYDLPFTQEQVDFAIPLLDDDIPLYVDPFLLFKSPSQQDRSLHMSVVASFNAIARKALANPSDRAALSDLISLTECAEVGLGSASQKKGRRIGEDTAHQIIGLFREVPQIKIGGLKHVDELQLLVAGISRDRISDITCSLVKSFLIDFTKDASTKHGIPAQRVTIENVYNDGTGKMESVTTDLPVNPVSGLPVLLVPRRWLRRQPWLNPDEFTKFTLDRDASAPSGGDAVLHYNRENYGMVLLYVAEKERTQADCKNDPLFSPIPVASAKRRFADIRKLPTGTTDKADKKYEDAASQLLASLLYPHLDFADEQVRAESGATIKDLIFYNNRSRDFLADIHKDYEARQLVFELKNVKEVEREHINQLNRYLSGPFGRFGVLVTRNPMPAAITKQTVDLWSGSRRCIVPLSDADLELMVTVFESKQREAIEVLKRAFVDFTRRLPT